MSSIPDWLIESGDMVATIASKAWDLVPGLLAALVLLLAGFLVARLLRGAAVQGLRGVDLVVQRVYHRHGIENPGRTLAAARVLGELVFWIVILFFLSAATQLLGIELFSAWMNRVLGYVPTLVIGILIVLAGILLSNLAHDLVVTATPVEPASRQLLGRSVQVVILVLAIVVGASQIGINTTFLVIVASILLGAIVIGLALAMSLGAKTYVSNLIGTRYLRDTYHVGQRVRIGEYEGTILDFSPTGVDLETDAGRMFLPGKVFQEQPSVLLVQDIDHGTR